MNLDKLKAVLTIFEESTVEFMKYRKDNEEVTFSKKGLCHETGAESAQVKEVESGADGLGVLKTQDELQAAAALNCHEVKSLYIGVVHFESSFNNGQGLISVRKGDLLCSIEAMKLFNHVTAPVDGSIIEILVQDGDYVECGQVLFKMKEA